MRRRDSIEGPEDADLPPRRRRNVTQVGKKLAVNLTPEDMARFKFRFINDAPGRLQQLYEDNWDIVSNDGGTVKPDSSDLGNAVSVIVGRKDDGSALRSYLCRKPLKYYREDRQRKQTELDEQLQQLRRGNTAAGELQGDYVPQGGIKIA